MLRFEFHFLPDNMSQSNKLKTLNFHLKLHFNNFLRLYSKYKYYFMEQLSILFRKQIIFGILF